MIESTPTPKQDFSVGSWRVSPATGQMVNLVGECKPLEPKVMQVLVVLALAEGQPVARQTLLDEVWSEAFVSDDTLNTAMSKLRKALGGTRPAMIRTIPKHGYQLVAQVSWEPPASENAHSQSPQRRFPVVSRGRGVAFAMVTSVVGLVIWAAFSFPEVEHTTANPYRWQPLTSMPGLEMAPAISPNASQVAFMASDKTGQKWDLHMTSVDRKVTRQLTFDGGFKGHPAWSPDGEKIAYQAFDTNGCGILLWQGVDHEPETLADCGSSTYADLAWSPDGNTLAFNTRLDAMAPFAIHLWDIASQTLKKVTAPDANYWGDHDPVCSPNGGEVAFVRSQNEGLQDIFLLDLESFQTRRLTSEHRLINGITWSEDGAHLIFSSNRQSHQQLWQISTMTGDIRSLPVTSWDAVTPAAAGDVLAFVAQQSETNIWRQVLASDSKSEPPKALIASTRWDLHPAISPNGEKVAFTSNRSGFYEIWSAAANGDDARQLTHFKGAFCSSPRWSPDGTRLLFDARIGGDANVFSLEPGSTPRQLTFSVADDLAPAWSTDGRGFYFTSNRSGRWQVWWRAISNGVSEMMTQNGGYACQEGPAGKFLYFTKYPEGGLWRQALTGGEEVQLDIPLNAGDWGNWTVTQSGIYFVRRQATGCYGEVCHFDWQTESTRALAQVGSLPSHDRALAIAPDETWLLFGQVDRKSADLVVGIRENGRF